MIYRLWFSFMVVFLASLAGASAAQTASIRLPAGWVQEERNGLLSPRDEADLQGAGYSAQETRQLQVQINERVRAFQSGAEAARGGGFARGGLQHGQRPRRLALGDLLALVGRDPVEDVAHAPARLTSLSRAPWARPSSITAPARSTPSRRVSTVSPTRKAAAAFSRTMSR